MKRPIFSNAETQQEFDREGIIRLPLFTPEEIDELKNVFIGLHPEWNDAMKHAYYFSVFGGDIKYRQKIYDTFMPLLQPKLEKIFSGFKSLAVIAQVKGTGGSSSVNIHQDLSVVDESQYYACTVWIPLMASTIENGAIYALNKSQQVFRQFRAHTLDYQFGRVQNFIMQNSKCYPAAKGEILIFDPACIHYSPPNKTNEVRLSLAVSVTSAEAPVQIGFFDKYSGGSAIELYDVPDNFWYLYSDFIKERLERPAFGKFNRTLENAVVVEYAEDSFINDYKRVSQ